MMRKFFGGGKSGDAKGGKRMIEGHSRKVSESEKVSMDKSATGLAKMTMDEAQFSSGLPREHLSLADKLDQHSAGTLFKYAVITNKPSDERQSMLSKLRGYKPQGKVENRTLDDIPPVRLLGETIVMSLADIISPADMKSPEAYISLDCVLVHFVPLDSYANDKSVVTVQINDQRRTTNQTARVAKIDNTMGYNILFCLDYCFEKRDVRKFSLTFSCSSKEFNPDSAWGAVKVVAQVQLRSFPVRLPLIGTMGVMLLSDTDLEHHGWDPREIDLVSTPEAFSLLQKAHARGEIENRTLPINNKKEMNTARTSFGVQEDEEEVGSVIERMKHQHQIESRREKARVENQRTLSKMNDSSLKEDRSNDPETFESDRTLEEIKPEDSTSNTGPTESEISAVLSSAGRKKVVGFRD